MLIKDKILNETYSNLSINLENNIKFIKKVIIEAKIKEDVNLKWKINFLNFYF